MPKSKLKVVTKHYGHIFPYTLIAIHKKEGDFLDMIKEALPLYPELGMMSHDMSLSTSGVISFVFNANSANIFLFLTDDFKLDTLVHECVHVVSRIFNRIGSEFTEDTEEFFAYLMDFMFREIYTLVTKQFKLPIEGFNKDND